MPQPDPMPSAATIAATVHAHFAGRPLRLFTRCYREQLGRAVVPAIPADAGDGGRPCPSCDGACVVPDCTAAACDCQLDPPCRQRACPDCGGLGTV